ncbi:MAG: glycosyltransferase, partial [Flavobacterium sp.]
IKLFGRLNLPKDVIYISLIPLYTFAFLIGNYINLRFGFKIIYTIHNNIELDFTGGRLLSLIKSFYFMKLRRSKNVYSVSEGLNRQLKKLNLSSHTLVNRVSHKYVAVDRCESVRLNFLMVGRLTEQKDYSASFRYFDILMKNNIEFSVDIFGEGPLKEELLDQVNQLSLSQYINFKEYTPDIEIVFNNDKYDAFLLTSNYEGFGLVILEAISKNLYPIARDCDFGPKEILSKGVGHLLPFEFSESDVLNSIAAYRVWATYSSVTQNNLSFSVFKYYLDKSEEAWSQIESYQ